MEQDAMALVREELGEATIVAISFFTENLINFAKDNFGISPELADDLEVYHSVGLSDICSLYIHTAPFV